MTGMEPALIAAIVGGVATIGSTVISAVSSNRQADKAAERQEKYQKQLAQQEAATEAAEKQKTQEALDRQNAYGASLLDGNTALDNMLSGGYSSDDISNSESLSLLGNTLQSGSTVQSMFA